jgi:hypothetical protein
MGQMEVDVETLSQEPFAVQQPLLVVSVRDELRRLRAGRLPSA